MKFKTKSVVVEAIKYQAELGNSRVMNWLAQQGADVTGWLFFDGEITIPTPDGGGSKKAVDGNWIIKGVQGEFHTCTAEVFASLYEEAPLSVDESKGPVVYREIQNSSKLLALRDFETAFRNIVRSYDNGNLPPVVRCLWSTLEDFIHRYSQRIPGPPDPPRPLGDRPVA